MDLETSFNLLVKLARDTKLTWNDHQKVTLAIETLLKALNNQTQSEVTEIHLGEDVPPEEEGEWEEEEEEEKPKEKKSK